MKNALRQVLAATPMLLAALAVHAGSGEALGRIRHFVVIYQENHSFDNLYGGWEGVNGLANARAVQVAQSGKAFACLAQTDVNLASPPLAVTCDDPENGIASHFANAPFPIEAYIPATARSCPRPGVSAPDGVPDGAGLPGGCTRDLVHRFYQEQYQINGGRMDRYVTGSDAAGLAVGYYDTRRLPVYAWLHRPGHPRYVVADHFFQAAFGGSFLNHHWLVAARTPEWPDAPNDGSANDLHTVLDADGMPASYRLYAAQGAVKDLALSASCQPAANRGATPAGAVCGDFAVNTVQPAAWPYAPGTPAARRLPPQTAPTIGERLSAAGIGWAWYSGGWANAEGDPAQPGYTNGGGPACGDPNATAGAVWPRCPDRLFQYHHQPFNYYARYAPGSAARREHLRDEAEFIQRVKASGRTCQLKAVSFVKPLGAENEHPGYASESTGSDHLVALLEALGNSACARDTMVVVTYDEFGGQADHVAPPGKGSAGPHDQWGPGTRIPALVIAPGLRHAFAVDHALHDTTSILSTLEHRYHLAPLGSRDAAARDLATVFEAAGVEAMRE